MTRTVFNAPLRISANPAQEMTPTVDEVVASLMAPSDPLKCEIPLYIGLFFDGTNNNRDRDMPERGHSNVARLFNAHKSVAENPEHTGHYKTYVSGLGTRFEPNQEPGESDEGKAYAKGGQARILYGVLEVFNSVHKAFNNEFALYKEDDIKALLKDFERQVDGGSTDPERPAPTRESWLANIYAHATQSIQDARKRKPLPNIPYIHVSVFGFSRGAAEASAFCHWLNAAIPSGEIAGMPLRIKFLGLFDCVASTGLADSARRALGPVAGFATGHFAWAKETRQALPALVERCVHMLGAHEQRLNFPLTRIRGGQLSEYVYPGVHSDVGGGYGLLAQGRSKTDAELLSQVPLLHMYKLARIAGVPLLDATLMSKQLLEDYALSPAVAQAWNDYMAQAQDYAPRTQPAPMATPLEECQDLHALIALHMRLYYDYRRIYLPPPPGKTAHVLAPDLFRLLHNPISAQDEDNIRSYNQNLQGDLSLFTQWQAAKQRDDWDPSTREGGQRRIWIDDTLRRHSNWLPQFICQQQNPADQAWIEVALGVLQGRSQVAGQAHCVLLGRYVHDSLAGFVLAGPITHDDKARLLVDIVHRQGKGKTLNAFEKTVFANYRKRVDAEDAGTVQVPQGQTPLRKLVKDRMDALNAMNATNRKDELDQEAAYNTKYRFGYADALYVSSCELYPVMRDEDAGLLQSWVKAKAIGIITSGRREGGGYFLPRAVFE
ncbi:T6SS phospholipase effector Tle1-like catalytic domain-containing protein [Rhodoferax aquaticus]|uniref:DUF2235 domain-containing protein n=1 Tax=Rhodoferax aquaticus TaxID=2527691 RepID=A0A515EPU6_9BURK|nr:DUF2235 domain-containing protein [Rhodoferax aquaticus]QDL54688.1 DUF2235 domain-containing protein [Rhodoferax aquaticus]